MKTAGNAGWASSPTGFMRRVLVAAFEDNILFLASALTFQALLAALPFGLLVLAVLGYVAHGGENPRDAVESFLHNFVPTAGSDAGDPFRQVERFVESIVESRGQFSIYGAPLFLWFSTRFFGGARAALNSVFDTQENRSWFQGVAVDFGLVATTLVLVVVNTIITVQVVDLPWLGRFASGLSTFILAVLLFVIIYKVAPTRRMRWDTAVVAAAVASLGFEIMKRLYVIYLDQYATLDRLITNRNVIALVLLLVWIYFTVCVFLVGAEVGETYDLRRRQREQRAILA